MIGVVIPLYNREKFIGPCLAQWIPFAKVVVVLSSVPWKIGGNEEDLTPDKSEEIIKRFKTVKIIKGRFEKQQESLLAGLKECQDCERIIIWDSDLFITSKDQTDFLNLIKEKDEPVIRINHETMFQEYYYDYRYGLPALTGGVYPIIAIACDVRLRKITSTEIAYREYVWNNPEIKLHHFRWCKPNGSGKYRCIEPLTSDGYTAAPEEIVNLINRSL